MSLGCAVPGEFRPRKPCHIRFVFRRTLSYVMGSLMRSCLCLCSQTRPAWPILLTLGNFSQDVSSTATAKRFITLMQFPHKRDSDPEEEHRFCTATLYLAVWEKVMGLVNNWAGGFWLTLLGRHAPSVLVPRIGIFLGDLLEMRAIAATSAAFSVRCETRLSNRDDGVDSGVESGESSESESEEADAHTSSDSEPDADVDAGPGIATVTVQARLPPGPPPGTARRAQILMLLRLPVRSNHM